MTDIEQREPVAAMWALLNRATAAEARVAELEGELDEALNGNVVPSSVWLRQMELTREATQRATTAEAEVERLRALVEEAREDCREAEEAREAMLAAASDFKAEALVARKTALEEAIDAIAKKKWFFASEEWVAHQCVTAIRALVKP